jgi:hypothetical protein
LAVAGGGVSGVAGSGATAFAGGASAVSGFGVAADGGADACVGDGAGMSGGVEAHQMPAPSAINAPPTTTTGAIGLRRAGATGSAARAAG